MKTLVTSWSSALRGASLLLAVLLVAGCGGGHDFETYIECYEHETEEGASSTLATSECDEHFSLTHTGEADCLADHAADVTAGVPQASIDDHCTDAFPMSDAGA